MAATAQREQAPRAGTLRRSLARAAPRVPLHVFEQPALDQAFAEAMARAQNDDARDGAIAADVFLRIPSSAEPTFTDWPLSCGYLGRPEIAELSPLFRIGQKEHFDPKRHTFGF